MDRLMATRVPHARDARQAQSSRPWGRMGTSCLPEQQHGHTRLVANLVAGTDVPQIEDEMMAGRGHGDHVASPFARRRQRISLPCW
jgi:hypothetical protein